MPMFPYCNNNYFMWFPPLPTNCDLPPTIYSILQSIVNYEKEEKTKTRDLCLIGRKTIFNFDYPLSNKITKEEFEKMILNHYLQRRIGFDTVTAFQIQLEVKLNEIMPVYNKMFDLIYSNLNLGNVTTKLSTDNRNTENTTELDNTTDTVTKHSSLPQDEIKAIENSSYMTDYTSSNNNSKSNGNSKTKDNNIYNEETISNNNLENMIKLKTELNNIYTLIYKDLDCLFYGLM